MRIAAADRVTRKPSPAEAVARLLPGTRMSRDAFHELYRLTPEKFKAELIEGVVYVSSPVHIRHSRPHLRIAHWLGCYLDETPGVDAFDNTTSILSSESEPQPDACLIVLPEFGGQVRFQNDQMPEGPIDLIVEIANASEEIDLGVKKTVYQNAGVREYLVVLAKSENIRWFHLRKNGYGELHPDREGIHRSIVFPGLWLDPRGLFSQSTHALRRAIEAGLASPEHAAFIAELKSRRKKKPARFRRKEKE